MAVQTKHHTICLHELLPQRRVIRWKDAEVTSQQSFSIFELKVESEQSNESIKVTFLKRSDFNAHSQLNQETNVTRTGTLIKCQYIFILDLYK